MLSPIEGLDLGERFDAILFGSHLINVLDVRVRDRFLAACRRHVTADGVVVILRYVRGWMAQAEEFDRPADAQGLSSSLRILGRPEPGVLHGRMTYTLGAETWQHEFTERDVDDEALPGILAQAELRLLRYLSEDGSWVLAAAG